MAHKILPVLVLGPLLQHAFGLRLCHHVVRVVVFVVALLSWHVVPVDVELGHSRFFCQDAPRQAFDDWRLGRVLVQLRSVVLHVDVVSTSKELLAVLVRARQQHCGNTDHVVWREIGHTWRFTLKQSKSQWDSTKSRQNLLTSKTNFICPGLLQSISASSRT